jgi:hypothetical protein
MYTLIMVLYALYVYLLYSCFIENHPIWILDDRTLISEVVLSHTGYDFLTVTKDGFEHVYV